MIWMILTVILFVQYLTRKPKNAVVFYDNPNPFGDHSREMTENGLDYLYDVFSAALRMDGDFWFTHKDTQPSRGS